AQPGLVPIAETAIRPIDDRGARGPEVEIRVGRVIAQIVTGVRIPGFETHRAVGKLADPWGVDESEIIERCLEDVETRLGGQGQRLLPQKAILVVDGEGS